MTRTNPFPGCALMRSAVLYSFVLLATMLVFGVTQAADRELVTVDHENPPTDLLAADEVERISALRDLVSWYAVSEPSPDGRTFFAGFSDSTGERDFIGFWPVDDGAEVPLIEPDEFIPLMAPSSFTWLDENHFGMLVNLEPDGSALGLARVDRRDGRVMMPNEPLSLTGEFLALSPGGRYLLTLAPTEEAEDQRAVPKIKRSRSLVSDEEQQLDIYTEPSRLMLFDRHDQTERELMTLPAGLMTPMPSFAADGRRLALVLNYGVGFDRGERSMEQVWVREALGQIPPAENPFYAQSELLTFDLEQPGLDPLRRKASELSGRVWNFDASQRPAWSPDGTRLAVSMALPAQIPGRAYPTFYKPEGHELLVFNDRMDVVGEVTNPLLGGPDDSRRFFWQGNDAILFVVVDGLSQAIYHHDMAGGVTQRLLAGGAFQWVRTLPDGRRIFILWSRADHPPELWVHDRVTGLTEQRTDFNRTAQEAASVQRHQVSFTLADGSVRQAFWFAPEDMTWPPEEQPVIFWQAGGPGAGMVDEWGVEVEMPLTLLPSLGVSVLMLPLQQRPGWGSEQWNALAGPGHFGSIDVDEMAEVAQQLVVRGWSRPDQLGISGCSYGGYLTAQSITRHPGLWAAANPQCSLLDLPTEFQTGYPDHIGYLLGASPWEDWGAYLDASPAYQGAQVQTPTLIFHGTRDFLPVGITENWFHELRGNGVQARMLRFRGEGHGLEYNANQMYAAQEQVLWFRNWLGNPAPEPGPEPEPEPESGGGGSLGWAGLLLFAASLLVRRRARLLFRGAGAPAGS